MLKAVDNSEADKKAYGAIVRAVYESADSGPDPEEAAAGALVKLGDFAIGAGAIGLCEIAELAELDGVCGAAVAASLSSSAASAAYVDAYQDHNWRAFAVDIAVTLGGGGLAERKFESYLVDRAVKDAAKQNVQLLFTPSAWVAEQVLVYVGTR